MPYCRLELPRLIPRNSVKLDHGCTSRIYLDTTGDNVTLTLYNVTLTSKKASYTITSSIPAKQTVINEVYVFSIKYRFSDILLKNT